MDKTQKQSIIDNINRSDYSDFNQRQFDFALNYYKTSNGTHSAIDAGYSPRSAFSIATRLLNKDKVQALINILREEEKRRFIEESVFSELEKEQILTKIGRGNLGQYANEKGEIVLTKENLESPAIAEIKITSGPEGEDGPLWTSKTIKIRDPIAAIREHNSMKDIGNKPQLLQDNRQVHFHIIGNPDKVKELQTAQGKILEGTTRQKLLEQSVGEEETGA